MEVRPKKEEQQQVSVDFLPHGALFWVGGSFLQKVRGANVSVHTVAAVDLQNGDLKHFTNSARVTPIQGYLQLT
jgi:hypothetical protein